MVGFVTLAKANSTPHPASALLPVKAWSSREYETKREIIEVGRGTVEGGEGKQTTIAFPNLGLFVRVGPLDSAHRKFSEVRITSYITN
jgi:hypothetical protein